MLNYDELQMAIGAAKRHFHLLQQKYPKLKAYLVISLPGGQIDIDDGLIKMLENFPAMVVDGPQKNKAINLFSLLPGKEKDPAGRRHLEQQLHELAGQLHYDEACQVEIRFHDLVFDLVWKLQVDELVDRGATPQTKAAIQIVLGTLAKFKGDKP